MSNNIQFNRRAISDQHKAVRSSQIALSAARDVIIAAEAVANGEAKEILAKYLRGIGL